MTVKKIFQDFKFQEENHDGHVIEARPASFYNN